MLFLPSPLCFPTMLTAIHHLSFVRHGLIRSVVVHAFLRARPEAGSMLAKEESECAKHSRGFQQAGPATYGPPRLQAK